MSTTERLEELLTAKDAEIERLQTELSEALDRKEKDFEWAEHVDLGEVYRPELPVPRLEMLWEKDDGESWRNCTALYRLIYRHLLGHLVAVPLGRTQTQSGADHSPATEPWSKNIRVPFRDGVHIATDSESLKLPAFVVCEDRIDIIRMKDGKCHQEPFQATETEAK